MKTLTVVKVTPSGLTFTRALSELSKDLTLAQKVKCTFWAPERFTVRWRYPVFERSRTWLFPSLGPSTLVRMLTSPDFVQGPLQPVPPEKVPDSKPSLAIGSVRGGGGLGVTGPAVRHFT